LKEGAVFRAEDFAGSKKKQVMLVVPPSSIEAEFGRLASAGAELPWLGMAYVAAAVRAAGHRVYLRDYDVEGKGWDIVRQDIARVKPDVIATAGFINNMDRCLKVFEIAKSVDPKIITVLGGPQATIFPDDAIQSPSLDFLTLSESEISFTRLVSYVEDRSAWKTFRGTIFRDPSTGTIVKNERQPLIQDLDSLPLPAHDLYPMQLYYPPVYIWGKKVANIVTSRGCPYDCTFCEAKMTFGRTFRYHSEARVLKDLDFLNRQYGYDSFQFYDDIFTTHRDRVTRLCEAMIREKRNYKWMCYTRTDRVDLELLRLMKRAGCYMISFGIESGSQVLLDKVRKKLTVETNQKGIESCVKAGLMAIGTFMLGLPGETTEQSQNTIRFALDSKLDYAVFGITEPYPGTDMWKDALEEGYFIDADSKHSNHLLPNFNKIWVPKGRDRDELEKLTRLAYRRFYLRPRIFLRWFRNFFHIPPGRSFRYLYSGFMYLIFFPLQDLAQSLSSRIASKFRKRKPGQETDGPKRHYGVKYG
jgi:radical SAM superfamily enzyme YgiQ (UPF0313 family)